MRHNVDVICPHDMLQELDVEPFCCGDVVAWLGPIGPNIDQHTTTNLKKRFLKIIYILLQRFVAQCVSAFHPLRGLWTKKYIVYSCLQVLGSIHGPRSWHLVADLKHYFHHDLLQKSHKERLQQVHLVWAYLHPLLRYTQRRYNKTQIVKFSELK